MNSNPKNLASLASATAALLMTASAFVMSSAARADAPAPWASTIKWGGNVEVGIGGNVDTPSDNINFGHFYTDDRSNQPMFNQLLLGIERDIDSGAAGYDYGFKIQGVYGQNARYFHAWGEFNHAYLGSQSDQFAFVEADVSAHLPTIGAGGTDVKAGQFPSPMGEEVIDSSGNIFYSHSYISFVGVPTVHTGALAVTHVSPMLDLYYGLDTGVNAFVDRKGMLNGNPWHGQAGFGLNNLAGGKLTILALTHIGPENTKIGYAGVGSADSALRYLSDILFTYKVNDNMSLILDTNYIRDDGYGVDGGGAAGYVTYTINDQWSAAGRAEVWADSKGFFVASFKGPFDLVNLSRGFGPVVAVTGGGNTTYGEFTAGLTYKPPVPKAITGLMIRPEIRYDTSFSSTKPFITGTQDHQLTLSADIVVPF